MVKFHYSRPGVEGHFNPQNGILRVSYTEKVTSEVTSAIYQWGWKLSESVGTENIYGMITDFRDVESFAPQSLGTALKESRRINQAFDLRRLPVALIVKNMYQEQLVNISTDLSGHPDRMKIVYSVEEALAFIDQWHETHKSGMSG